MPSTVMKYPANLLSNAFDFMRSYCMPKKLEAHEPNSGRMRLFIQLNRVALPERLTEPLPNSPANVNGWSLRRVILSLTQDLVRHGSSIALAESYVLEQICERIAFAPTEVDVR
jgi:hypothetical protein